MALLSPDRRQRSAAMAAHYWISETRWSKAIWDLVWSVLTGMALFTILLPFFRPPSLSTSRWRSSLFNEWEVSKARYPHLLDSIVRVRQVEPAREDLWTAPVKGWGACSHIPSSPSSVGIPTEGYLQVFLEGGLNQQRMGVCDAVAVAKMLNLTLVLPHFDVNPVWQDNSMFADIFDLDHFLRCLENDVHIVTELPSEFSWSTREYYGTAFRENRIKDAPSQASPAWYQNRVLPVVKMHGIAAIAPFSHRLGFDDLPSSIQMLRCRVNFEALRFKPTIRSLGDLIVQRLQGSSPWELVRNHTVHTLADTMGTKGLTKYFALHLRFDKDMAAHSACDFGGGIAEDRALAKYRRQVWRGGVRNDIYTVEQIREQGKCPLTPEEVAIMLAGLGFPSDTIIYLASYQVYGGEGRMSHLRALFPFLVDKYSLTTDAEIQPFEGKASQLSALDYHVSLHSDAFLSASRGNMHNALVGHRAYEHEGLTIRADMVLLAQLFGNKSLPWDEFQETLRFGHRNRMGQLNMRKSSQSIYTYPAPDCMCP